MHTALLILTVTSCSEQTGQDKELYIAPSDYPPSDANMTAIGREKEAGYWDELKP